MRENTRGAFLQEEKNICTQRQAEKRVWTLAVCWRGIWYAYNRPRWARRKERRLEKGPLDFFQMRLPELKMSTGDEGSSNGVVKNIFDSELGYNAGLIVRDPKLLCNLMASLRGQDVCGFNGSERQ